MHRRDFLHPRQLAQVTGYALAAAEVAASADHASEPLQYTLLRLQRRAMATTFEVVLPFQTPDASALASAALDQIDTLEARLSVYRDDSEISLINQIAAFEPVQVADDLFALLDHCLTLTRQTDGAFDVAAGALVKAWGFHRRQARVPTKAELIEALSRSGSRHIRLDRQRRSVALARPGVEINLGSIGKGYALDRAAELLLQRADLPSVLLHGGYSSVYAIGTPPGDDRGWPIGLRHPWNRDRQLAIVRLRDRGLGTSAATFQHLVHQGRKLGHVLDPRTGWPADTLVSATALAPSAAEADALATAFFIQGVAWTRNYCADHPEVAALLIPAQLDAHPVVLGIQDVDLEPGSAALAS
jgi:thiamine biosynthesis lipoprotein